MSLKTLRDHLRLMPSDAPVMLDFGVYVGDLDSWRGDYSEATLTWAESPSRRLTVEALLRKVEGALGGATFQGYKRGDYTFGEWTEVYADDYGDYNGNRTLAVVDRTGIAVVITQPGGGVDR